MEATKRQSLSILMSEAAGARIKGSYTAFESYKARISDLALDPKDYERAIKSLAKAMRI